MALLEIRGLRKTFGSGARAVPALRGVDLDVAAGETVGLVGESGCGKTTLGRIVAGLERATAGTLRFAGEDLGELLADRRARGRVQMVFQHPDASLNRRMRVGTAIREPRQLLGDGQGDVDARVDELLELVGLSPEFRDRRPRSLSGGQQQRVAIARALMSDPDLVVLDEPTSSLDQSVRGRIISLLKDIQRSRHVAYLFISHDLSTVRRIASRVAVMYLGRIVEIAAASAIFEAPQHPYTKALLSAVPSLHPEDRKLRIRLPGETPNPSELPAGCSFQDRCPLVHDRCRADQPVLGAYAPGHDVECFAVATTVGSAS